MSDVLTLLFQGALVGVVVAVAIGMVLEFLLSRDR